MNWGRFAGRIAGAWKRLQGGARRRWERLAREKQLAEWTAERDRIDPIHK